MTDGGTDPDTPVFGSSGLQLDTNQRLGIGLIVGGFVLLVLLRFVTSPIGREVTGYSAIGLGEFLLIPVFLLVVGLGIVVLIWGGEWW